MIRGVAVLGFLAFSGFMTFGCSDRPIESPMEPQFAKPVKPPEFTITDLTVVKIQLDEGETRPISYDEPIRNAVAAYAVQNGVAANFFGCPDPYRTCNELTLFFEGALETFTFYVSHDPGQLYYSTDTDLVNRTLAAIWWEMAIPTLQLAGKTSPLVVYWQGQREIGYGSISWTLMPDLDVVGPEDQFVFSCSFSTISGGKMCGQGTFMYSENGSAAYDGDDIPNTRAYIVLDTIQLVTNGGSPNPKKKPPPSSTYLTFDAQAFADLGPFSGPPEYSDPGIYLKSVGANFRLMLIKPGGQKSFLLHSSRGANANHPTKPMIERERFQVGPFSEPGCHTIEVVGVYVYDALAADVVWNRTDDIGDMAQPIWINYVATNPSASTSGRGASCSG